MASFVDKSVAVRQLQSPTQETEEAGNRPRKQNVAKTLLKNIH